MLRKETIYIYGCGVYGTKLCCLLESYGIDIKGYIVSDNQKKLSMDKKVKYVSEVEGEKCTIILGMNMANQKSLSVNADEFLQMNKHVVAFLNMYM